MGKIFHNCQDIGVTVLWGNSLYPLRVVDIHSILLFFSSSCLIIWAWRRHRKFERIAVNDRDLNRDFFSQSAYAIFPIHVWILLLLGFSLFVQAFYIFFDRGNADVESSYFNQAYSYYTIAFSAVSTGITALLLSSGIGRFAMKVACAVGTLAGVVMFTLVEFRWLWAYVSFSGINCLFYFCAVVFPNQGPFFYRRPGAQIWLQFLFW